MQNNQMKTTLLNKAARNTMLFLPVNAGNVEEVKNLLRQYPLSWEVLAGMPLYPIEEEWLAPYVAQMEDYDAEEGKTWLQCCFAQCGISEDWTEHNMPTVRMRQAFQAMCSWYAEV
jgi:hypothetical protein